MAPKVSKRGRGIRPTLSASKDMGVQHLAAAFPAQMANERTRMGSTTWNNTNNPRA